MKIGEKLQEQMTRYIDKKRFSQLFEMAFQKHRATIPEAQREAVTMAMREEAEHLRTVIYKKLTFYLLNLLEEAIRIKRLRTRDFFTLPETSRTELVMTPNDNTRMIHDYNTNFLKQDKGAQKDVFRVEQFAQMKKGSFPADTSQQDRPYYSKVVNDQSSIGDGSKEGNSDATSIGNYCILYYFRNIHKAFPHISSVFEFKDRLDKEYMRMLNDQAGLGPQSPIRDKYFKALADFKRKIENMIDRQADFSDFYVAPVTTIDVIHAVNATLINIPKRYTDYMFRTDLAFNPDTKIINSFDLLNSCVFNFAEMSELKVLMEYWKNIP